MDLHTVMVWAAIGLICFILTNAAFIDLALKDFGSTGKKAAWGIVALVPFIGFFVYFIFGARKGTRKTQVEAP